MNINIVIYIKNVKKGKNKYWLAFEAFVGFYDANKVYIIDFNGMDIYSSIPLTDEQEEQLKKMLTVDFGYAPFDIDKAKQIIGNGKNYTIKI